MPAPKSDDRGSSDNSAVLEQILQEQRDIVQRVLLQSAEQILKLSSARRDPFLAADLEERQVATDAAQTQPEGGGRRVASRNSASGKNPNNLRLHFTTDAAMGQADTVTSDPGPPEEQLSDLNLNRSFNAGGLSPDQSLPGVVVPADSSADFNSILPSRDPPPLRPARQASVEFGGQTAVEFEASPSQLKDSRPSAATSGTTCEDKPTKPVDRALSWARRGRSSSILRSIDSGSDSGDEGKLPGMQNFIDAEQMKTQVRETLLRPKRNITSFYKKEGLSQAIARSSAFEQITLLVVIFNSLYIAIETDFNDASVLFQAHPVFIVVENLFCAAFVLEWVIRFRALDSKWHIMQDRWYLFDTVLVVTMVIETWILPGVLFVSTNGNSNSGETVNASVLRVVRLLRLSRMARVARVLRAMPELLILIKALLAAMRSVFFTLLLLVIVLYIFGITFTQLTADSEVGDDLFSSVPTSMYNLLLFGVLSLDFLKDISLRLSKVSFVLPILLFTFVLVAAMTVMNMLIGVLCEVVGVVAAIEKEALLVSYTKGKVQAVVKDLDSDGDNRISKDEFVAILSSKHACRALHDVGVDVVGLIDFADSIFYDAIEQQETCLTFESFMEVVLKLRSTNSATVKDIFSLGRVFTKTCTKLDSSLDELKEMMASLDARTSAVGSTSASPLNSPTRSVGSRRRTTATTPRTITNFGSLWA